MIQTMECSDPPAALPSPPRREPSPEPSGKPGFWPDTQTAWIDGLKTPETAQEAARNLAALYRQPILRRIRVEAPELSPQDVEDLCHKFLIEEFLSLGQPGKSVPERFDPGKGRLRGYLSAALRNFLNDTRRSRGRIKNGGGVEHVPIDQVEHGLPGVSPSPDEGFDRLWALHVFSVALDKLKREWSTTPERPARFAVLHPFLVGEDDGRSLKELAEALGVSSAAFRQTKVDLRRRWLRHLKAAIAPTVARPADVEEELRHLCRVLQEWRGGGSDSSP